MSILFHSKTEVRMTMTVPDGFSHNTPKASENTPCWWKVKALLLGRLHSQRKKNHDVLTKDRHLEKSLLSQYFVPEKRASNFPFFSQLHFFSTGLKTSNVKQKRKAKQKGSNFTTVLSLCTLHS